MPVSFIFFLFLGYILYRFIAGFVLPVARTAKGMKQQFDQMKQQGGFQTDGPADDTKHARSFSAENKGQQRTTSGRKGAKEDYIDFEELPTSKF